MPDVATVTQSATPTANILADNAARIPELACMRANELAKLLGVNRKTVYEYAARNVIPCRRLGRRFVFSRAAVLAWLARHSSPGGAGSVR